jgi:DNA-directed RNA polymerase specialized sigma24 family protein
MAQLEQMIIREIPSLRAYARLLVGERIRADDLVQDCLERAWSRSHLFRADGDMRVWLFAILHNLYVSDIRQQQRRPTVVPLAEHAETLAAPPREDFYMARISIGRSPNCRPSSGRPCCSSESKT